MTEIIFPQNKQNVKGCLLVVTYYGFKQPIRTACQNFSDCSDWIVVEFPMFRYRNDVYDKKENYADLFCTAVFQTKPDAILFWYNNLTQLEMQLLRDKIDPKIPFLIFNWDDPHMWYDSHSHLPSIAKYFDGALTSSRVCVQRYLDSSASNEDRRKVYPQFFATYCLPGFDKNLVLNTTTATTTRKPFACDISFITTNLYEDETQYSRQRINRCKLVDAIYELHKKKELIFHIYGPEFLQRKYEQSYQGFCEYEKQYLVNQNSKIVLSTHVVTEQGYCNERVCVALGCGAIIMSDIPDPDIYQKKSAEDIKKLTEKIHVFDTGSTVESALENIKKILTLPDFETNAIRQQNAKIAAENLSWQCWADVVAKVLLQLKVSPDAENAKKVFHAVVEPVQSTRIAQTHSSANLTPGEWDIMSAEKIIADDDDGELKKALESTINFYDGKEKTPQLAVPYQRQYMLSQIIDSIGNSKDEKTTQLNLLLDLMSKNPNLDMNSILDFHWHSSDAKIN